MRAAIAIAAALLLAGCGDVLGPGLPAISGTYELEEWNGAALPAPYAPGDRWRVAGGTLSIDRGRFDLVLRVVPDPRFEEDMPVRTIGKVRRVGREEGTRLVRLLAVTQSPAIGATITREGLELRADDLGSVTVSEWRRGR